MSLSMLRAPVSLALPCVSRLTPRLIGLMMLALAASGPAWSASCISLTTLGSASTQNFDALGSATTATWTDGTTLPGGYATLATYIAGTGTGTGGGLYSFGSTVLPADRSLGSIPTNAIGEIDYALCFVNNTGSTLTSVDIAYVGEQWRNNGNATAQALSFEYQVAAVGVISDANVPNTGWTGVAALTFTGPIATATAAALDGNAAANRVALSNSVALSVPVGQELWLRWRDLNDSGNDHALAVDDFSMTPQGAPATGLSIADVSLAEGNAGTTSFTFTASLSAPAPAGGVTFNIASADGSATAGSDYTANSATGLSIAVGASSATFTVLVNGDTTFETNETFTVTVSNVVGVGLVDGVAIGTIVNDDSGSTLSINDVSHNEGNAGTTSYVFTVGLSQPAPAGGVSFSIATADGTAVAPADYTAKSLTAQTIAADASTYTFEVLVNGDVTAENDETFVVNVSNVTNALVGDGHGVGSIVNDDIAKIHDVQGTGAVSPIGAAAIVSVEGVVTANFQGTSKLSGFFVQEEDADADSDPLTSEGIFVFCSTCSTAVAEGQRVRVTGTVSEYFTMTQINATTAGSVVVIDAGNHLADITPATIALPVAGVVDDYYEPREGMLVKFTDALSVSEYFELNRYGQIELYQGGRPRQYTETNVPSVPGLVTHLDGLERRRVILDDDNNIQNSLLNLPDGSQFAYYPRQNGGFSVGVQGTDFFRGGDIVNNLTGVLHHSFSGLTGTDAWRIRPTVATPPVFTVANPRNATAPYVGGAIKAVGMNLLNYFTTIDTTSSDTSGPCGPDGTQDCRGADSIAELGRQRDRAVLVLCKLLPDVAGLMELENTTPNATISDLLGSVNTQCGGVIHPYTYANTGSTLGGDAIRVQIIYRTGIVAPVGAPQVDLDAINSRPTMAQTFDVVDAGNPAFGERFTLVANHLKSKGCGSATGGDLDSSDGQGCYSQRRTSQATRLLTWLNSTVIPAAGDSDVLLVGDFNSYAKEPPVTTLTSAGYVDLETSLLGSAAYSYLFDGQLGHLDYAFASPSLSSKVTGVAAWHINADEVPLFDYNDAIRDIGEAAIEKKPNGSALTPARNVFESGVPFRASDHDPVIVGLFADGDLIFRNGFDGPVVP